MLLLRQEGCHVHRGAEVAKVIAFLKRVVGSDERLARAQAELDEKYAELEAQTEQLDNLRSKLSEAQRYVSTRRESNRRNGDDLQKSINTTALRQGNGRPRENSDPP